MINMRFAAVFAVLIISATSTYLYLNSGGRTYSSSESDGFQGVDFSSLSDEDIDLIIAIKEKMNGIVPSAHAAEAE